MTYLEIVTCQINRCVSDIVRPARHVSGVRSLNTVAIFSILLSAASAPPDERPKMAVTTGPGAMTFTLMLCVAKFMAANFDNCDTAAFAPQYAKFPNSTLLAAIEEILMMLPPPRFAISVAACFMP